MRFIALVGALNFCGCVSGIQHLRDPIESPSQRAPEERAAVTTALSVVGVGLVGTGMAMAECGDGQFGCKREDTRNVVGGFGYTTAALGVGALLMIPIYLLSSRR